MHFGARVQNRSGEACANRMGQYLRQVGCTTGHARRTAGFRGGMRVISAGTSKLRAEKPQFSLENRV